ncbi:MAG: type I-E CRISPR-associated protein Cas7/Cse4/CasC [Gammaproteobacteria bacterium]|nr:type I-E CRISPR-associated protein Cas7/Cse4/CasC [Gammaproteobacteria bacterium]
MFDFKTLHPHTRVQIHALKNHAASNLNRDDTGRPKELYFGGVPRLRLSSQSIKKAIRTGEVFEQFRAHAHAAYGASKMLRTTLISSLLRRKFAAAGAISETESKAAIQEILTLFKKEDAKKEEKTSDGDLKTQLLALSEAEIDAIAAHFLSVPDRSAKNWAKKALDEYAKQRKERALRDDLSPEMQLFGRMITTDRIFSNIDAPLQVAHAFTTHQAKIERDYWTGVGDSVEENNMQGSDMIDVRRFGSGVFYHYACLDVDLLTQNMRTAFPNLEKEKLTELVKDLIHAFVLAFATQNPTGYQNSFASHAPADMLAIETGGFFPHSAAGAFEIPVEADKNKNYSVKGGYLQGSIEALRKWDQKRQKKYAGYTGKLESMGLHEEDAHTLDSLIAHTLLQVEPGITKIAERQ